MKVGDYVLVEGDKMGKVMQLNFHPMYHLVWLLDKSMPMATLKHQQHLTPLDPNLTPLLNATQGEE